MIDCDTVLELAGNYANEELIESMRERIDRHLVACATCSSFYEAEREVAVRLHQAQSVRPAGQWFADRLLSRLALDNDALIDRSVASDPAQLSFREPTFPA